VYAGTNVGVYKSTDAGESWHSANKGFPELDIKQTLDVTIQGEQFRYALTYGAPPVYRKSFARNSNWISMSWMVHGPGDSLKYDETTGELILFTKNHTYRSKDGGVRWDVPVLSYTSICNLAVSAPFSSNRQNPEMWTLEVDISGDVCFEDKAVDLLYKRPPYVSLQLVSSHYPCDRSIPYWSTNWERYLKGILQIPRDKLQENKDYMLYIEVRDFQKNVQVGYSMVNPNKDQNVTITVNPVLYLPCSDLKDQD
jgi:hypothetical protein